MKPKGRPRKEPDEKLVPLSTNVKPATYDALCRKAKENGEKVSEFVRKALDRQA